MTDTTDKDVAAEFGIEEAAADEAGKSSTEATASETTQEEPAKETTETDWKAEARKWENRSKENKEKADKFDAANTKVSELEKQVADLTKSHEEALSASALEAMRWRVAAKHGVSEDDVELFLNGTDEETLTKQAERLSQSSTHAPKPDSAQGKRNNGEVSTRQQAAASLGSLFN